MKNDAVSGRNDMVVLHALNGMHLWRKMIFLTDN
jgi:hypothetical protein